MQFFKMQALGNDFIVYGSPSKTTLPTASQIKQLCDRKYGVGADCVIFIGQSAFCDYFMHVYNPDGFEAEICGNALRCSAKYVNQCGYFNKKLLNIETRSGQRTAVIDGDFIKCEIGLPEILQQGVIDINGVSLPYFYISVGNPHCVIFTDYSLSDQEFYHYGPIIERHPTFPNGTNVEFAGVSDNNKIVMRVWERGIGETLSCSTGSCACVAAAQSKGFCGNNVQVYQPGGIIEVTTENKTMYINGKCNTVFTGKIAL